MEARVPRVAAAEAALSGAAAPSATRVVADAVAVALAEAGTAVAFGVPGGGANLDMVGALQDHGIRFVLAHGETAAAIMAATYGELTGAPGVCLVTRGPGAASAVNGVAQALLDRAPLLLLADAVAPEDGVRVSRQRLDQRALFAPVSKWSAAIGVEGAADTASRAVEVAVAGPPGPVHLDLIPSAPLAAAPPAPRATAAPDEALGLVERIVRDAERPVVALGLGARSAAPAVRAALRDSGVPVLSTYKAKGVVPDTWENAAGLLTGATIEAPVLQTADAIVAVGLDPVELIPAPWPYDAPVVALAEWPAEARYFELAAEVVAPLVETVPRVLPVARRRHAASAREARLAATATLEVPVAGLAPHDVVRAFRTAAPRGTALTVDSGAHMLVAMPLWDADEPGEVLISSGHATMGFALPAAITAALVRDGYVVCFVGDGGLGMTLPELETVARLGLAVVIVVFDDAALTLIEIKQAASGQGGREAVRYAPVDFAAVANACGIESRRVEQPSELRAAAALAFRERRPFLVDVQIDASGYRSVLRAVRG